MSIKLIEREHTTRTYPRLMKHRRSGNIVMTLHDHVGGMVWLNGEFAGKLIAGSSANWEGFDDYVGSVTLHNAD
jgi:predicted secreted hydrolase